METAEININSSLTTSKKIQHIFLKVTKQNFFVKRNTRHPFSKQPQQVKIFYFLSPFPAKKKDSRLFHFISLFLRQTKQRHSIENCAITVTLRKKSALFVKDGGKMKESSTNTAFESKKNKKSIIMYFYHYT